MKKFTAILIVAIMVLTFLTACGNTTQTPTGTPTKNPAVNDPRIPSTVTSSSDNEKPFGQYIDKTGKYYYVFAGRKMTFYMDGTEAVGTFEIRGDKIYMEYTVIGMDLSNEVSYYKNGDVLTIDGFDYTKVK